MTDISRKEALDAVNKAREKAQNAADKIQRHLLTPTTERFTAGFDPEMEALRLHYDRCVRELEEAINAASEWLATEENE